MSEDPARRLRFASLAMLGALLCGPRWPACATLFLIGDSAAGSDAMTDDTVYMGHRLRLSATRSADGSWTGAAEFLDEPLPAVTAPGFASQAEALQGALSRAMAAIDVERRFRGKP